MLLSFASSRFFRRASSVASRGSSNFGCRAASSSTSLYPVIRRKGEKVAVISVSLITGLAVGGWWDDKYNYGTITRNFRTAYTGVLVAVDYKLNFDPNSLTAIDALHERAAERLLRVCEKNRGLYVKLAQALGTQPAILPQPYLRLAKLLDDAEHFDYEAVEEIVRRELGAPINELFVRFDKEPIAAASIAQVHRARIRLPSGKEEEVAVKVQRPDIRRHAEWDLLAFRTLMQMYDYFFDLPLSFAAQYISDQIMQETLFDNEAANSNKIRSLIMNSRTPSIRNAAYVPRIYEFLSTPKILTMEFISDACKLTDLNNIENMGLDVKAVARSTIDVFAAQIFRMGFVQTDGHPSNVLVRRHPNGVKGQHQIVLIDHGLYVSLSPEFRQQYSRLWYALFMQDLRTTIEICRGWGIGQAELFASATLLRPWRARQRSVMSSSISSNLTSAQHAPKDESEETKEERELRARRELKEKLKTLLINVELLPKELIFVGRAMRILQANNHAMGSPVNRINILARQAAASLLDSRYLNRGNEDVTRSAVILYNVRRYTSFFRFRLALFLVDAAFRISGVLAWLHVIQQRVVAFFMCGTSSLPILKARKFEDELEENLRNIARTEFGMQISVDAFNS